MSIQSIIVTGSTDGPGSVNRAFSYFDLIFYTFTDFSNPNTYHYTLLFASGPVTPSPSGSERVAANVNLTNVGPYFVYQFGALDSTPGLQDIGPRIYSAQAFTDALVTPEPLMAIPLSMALVLLGYAKRRTLLN